MKQVTLILSLLFITSIMSLYACDCDSKGEFLTVAESSKLVALVKVNRYLTYKSIYNKKTPTSMEVELVRVFNGNETKKFITVWGDNGALCRPYLDIFAIGSYYIIAFGEGTDTNGVNANKEEKKSDYAISNCGSYWLNANIEKNLATGIVAKNKSNIEFEELWEYFNGEKTKQLTPNDFREIFQLALDLPELQQYYHIDKNSVRKNIFIQYFGDANHDSLKGVMKFNRQVIILDKKEIINKNVKYYFVLGDWICGKDFVRMQLCYVGEGLTASYSFRKLDDEWIIDKSKLWEE